MKDTVKRLLEGSPSKFFGEIRSKLDAKAVNIVESVASTVADTVFEEGKKADRDEDKVAVSNKNIQKNIENKTPETIKNKKAVSTMGESVEQLDELSRGTLASYTSKSIKSKDKAKYQMDKAFDHHIKTGGGNFRDTSKRLGRTIDNREKGVDSALKRLAKEEVELNEKQDTKMLGRYRVVHKETGAVMGSHDDKTKAIEIGRKAGAGSCRLVDTNKGMNESINESYSHAQDIGDGYKIHYKKGHSDDGMTGDLHHNNKHVGHYESFGGLVWTKDKDGGKSVAHHASHIDPAHAHDGAGWKDSINSMKKHWNKKLGLNEDLGAHTISTKHGGKNGKSFTTFVVNKKRVSKEAQQRKWQDMIKKATPKETVWDKHTKQ